MVENSKTNSTGRVLIKFKMVVKAVKLHRLGGL